MSTPAADSQTPVPGLPRNRRGITLVELMITLAIVVGLLGAGAYSMGLLSQSGLKNEAMRMTSAINYTWSRAAMNNAQYRMVFDLEKGSYHTEITDAPVVRQDQPDEESEEFISEEARRAQEREQEEQMGTQDDSDPFNASKKPTYEQVEDSVLKPHTLPADIRIDQVVPCDREKTIREGRAAIHFFPNGFQQPAIIVLTNGKGSFYSLKTEPLTGRVKLFSEKLDDTEDCGAPEEVQDEW